MKKYLAFQVYIKNPPIMDLPLTRVDFKKENDIIRNDKFFPYAI